MKMSSRQGEKSIYRDSHYVVESGTHPPFFPTHHFIPSPHPQTMTANASLSFQRVMEENQRLKREVLSLMSQSSVVRSLQSQSDQHHADRDNAADLQMQLLQSTVRHLTRPLSAGPAARSAPVSSRSMSDLAELYLRWKTSTMELQQALEEHLFPAVTKHHDKCLTMLRL
jgi:hypothetical protein